MPPISHFVAILAGVSLLAGIVLYIWLPKSRLKLASLIVYATLFVAVTSLVLNSGGVGSPFLALWILTAVLAGYFGKAVVAVLGFLIISLILLITLGDGQLNNQDDLLARLLGILSPLVLSLLIWYRPPSNEQSRITLDTPDNSQLNRITDQSEFIINAIGDGVLAIDARGVIRLINPAAEALIGWSHHDAVSLDYRSVLQLGTIDGTELSPAEDPIALAINSNQQYRTNNISLMTNSGKRLIISMVVSPIGDTGDGVIANFRDITKEKAEEREQAEFISTASHEMRTPVASIEGYLGLALNPNTAAVDERARAYIEKAHESTQHLGRLFQDLLDITKAEDGRLTSKPALIDAVYYVGEIAAGLKPQADQKGLKLTFKSVASSASERQLSPVFYINQDKDHFREVIANLIENGIKYTPGGQVVIDVTGDDEFVTISIKDSGIGIPAEDIPHLFQKFYRVDNTDTRTIGGTGLGLYLCRRLVESMNGRIWVESEYQKGSTFFVTLPRVNPSDVPELQDAQTQAQAQPQMQLPPQAAVQPPVPAPALVQPQYPQQPPIAPSPPPNYPGGQ